MRRIGCGGSVFGAIPTEKDAVVSAIAVAKRNFALVPDGKIFALDVAARCARRREVSILVEGCKRDVGGVPVTIEVDGVRQPGARDAPILENGNVLAMIFECRFEKRGDIRFRDAALLVTGHQRF